MIPRNSTGAILLAGALGMAAFAEPTVIPAGMTSRTTGRGVAKCRAHRKVRNRMASKSRARNRS